MTRIPMTNNHKLLPEGEYIFKIEKASYDEDFGKVKIELVTEKGYKCFENYSLKNSDDSWNDKTLYAFSLFAKAALNDFDRADIDVEEFIGKYIKARVIHNKVPSKLNPNDVITFVNLGEKSSATGFLKEDIDIDIDKELE